MATKTHTRRFSILRIERASRQIVRMRRRAAIHQYNFGQPVGCYLANRTVDWLAVGLVYGYLPVAGCCRLLIAGNWWTTAECHNV